VGTGKASEAHKKELKTGRSAISDSREGNCNCPRHQAVPSKIEKRRCGEGEKKPFAVGPAEADRMIEPALF
jgi:uncharacterized low-complexity protein